MTLGAKVKKYRELREMTQQDMAERLYVSVPAVSQWENGRTQPDMEKLPDLARLLGVTVDALLGEDESVSAVPTLRDSLFSVEHMYSRLKTFAEVHMPPRWCALTAAHGAT